jgi:lysophospholipase L1-like esterase
LTSNASGNRSTPAQLHPSLNRLRLWGYETPPESSELSNDKAAAEVAALGGVDNREGLSEELGETRAEAVREEVTEQAPAAFLPAARAEQVDVDPQATWIVDEAHSLNPFFAALKATAEKRPGSLTRILFHGDSMVASDFVTSTLRRAFQRQFGDGGHGFVLTTDAWPSYFHNDIFRTASSGFRASRVVGPFAKDGFYGLGGVSFEAAPGIRTTVGTVDSGEFGRSVSLFRVLYLKQPRGGVLRLFVDGTLHGEIDTDAPDVEAASYDIQLPEAAHRLELVVARAVTRTFGIILEREGPGVVLDAIGIQGARIRFLDKQDDAHWAEQLKARQPQLIAYQFGANESGDGFAYPMVDYHATMKAVLEQAKRAVPGAACLVVGALDRARKENDVLITVPIIPHIVREQERTAKEVGCAFWNTYQAMGGRGSMATWVRRGRANADMTHPNGYGADLIGKWLYAALMQSYNAYLLENKSAPEKADTN